MSYLAYCIVAFTWIQLLVALLNAVSARRRQTAVGSYQGVVSVLIPARNEEDTIGLLLSDLQRQEDLELEILVFNDLSTDDTMGVVTRCAQRDSRVRLVNSEGLPAGWLGKNYGCHSLAQRAKGDYLLFLDADVRLKEGVIAEAVALAEKGQTGLLSIFPSQIMRSVGEYLTVPIMNYILLTLLPLMLVRRSSFVSLAAANGQFMLFKRDRYVETRPHEVFKNSRVEDIEMARYLKERKIAVACLLGDERVTCRMYTGFNDAVNGFSKNVIHFFGNSWGAAVAFWLVTSFGFLVVLSILPTVVGCLFLVAVVATRVVVSVASKQNVWLNVLLLMAQQCVLGYLIWKAIVYSYNGQLKWKGRSI